MHSIALSKLPIRIHVNGARGKSSVTRLISAGLRAGGLKTVGKVTGSVSRIINEHGKDLVIHRLRSASIGEQVKLIRNFSKKNLDAVVIECMAVQPQYQWISEHKMLKSTIGVITNVRPDHLDEMGSTMTDIAYSLTNTIPYNRTLVTAERDTLIPLQEVAKKRNSKINVVNTKTISSEYMNKFPYLEHTENVAIALQVCNEVGIDEKTALDGMLRVTPDPGALVIWKISMTNPHQFVSAFAANDPKSTLKIWNVLKKRIKDEKICIFLNTRVDREYRTKQLSSIILHNIKPDLLIIRAESIPEILKQSDMNIKLFPIKSTPENIVDYFNNLDSHFIMGIGNIVGWGESFVSIMKEYRF